MISMPQSLALLFVLIYLIALVCYLFSETSGNHRRRTINKGILAFLFPVYSIGMTVWSGQLGGIQLILLVGLLFCSAGDMLLLRSFSKGGTVFGIGNLILFGYLVWYMVQKGLRFRQFWWFLLLLLFFFGGAMLLREKGWISFEPFQKQFSAYLWSVSMHGTLAITALFLLHDTKSVLLCTGLLLYMISDYFIGLHKFKYRKSKTILRLNSSTYFVGMMLVALSTGIGGTLG